jgi:hypothetical protein
VASKKTATTTEPQQKPQQMAPVATKQNGVTSANHEQIARRAYEIYLARGGEHGRHQDDWTQAERELRLGRQ